jgi:PA domain-containing protein
MKQLYSKLFAVLFCLVIGVMASSSIFGADVIIQNGDTGTTGFNDTTPVSPVGGNSGTTLGAQRMIALQHAASIWGATLMSGPTITIRATWQPLSCTATAGTLASAGNFAGSGSIWRNFTGAVVPNTWYGNALANALSGVDQNGSSPEIQAQFNLSIGNAGCLEAAHWYYGLDTNHGSGGINLVSVGLHEFGHGLGFQTFTNSSSGLQAFGVPSIYDRFLMDNSTGKLWPDMTNAERAASAINTTHLVWNGPKVKADAPAVLKSPLLKVNSPPAIAGNYEIGTADFGAPLSSPGVTANVVQARDPADGTGPTTTDGCSDLTNAVEVSGKIALIDRGLCTFVSKVENAQDAGAVGVIIVNNVDGAPPGMGGSDDAITIPVVSITNVSGNAIKGQLASGVNATLLLDGSVLAGADSAGRARLFSPNPFEGGSSVSHWDTTAFPNLLMEPNISGDLTHNVTVPFDLTTSLFTDLGWLTSISTPTPTPTPSQYFVSGRVVDNQNNPVSDVLITFETDMQGIKFHSMTTTDANGNYSSTNLGCPNSVKVTPSKTSYTFSPLGIIFVTTQCLSGTATANFTATLQGPTIFVEEGAVNRALALDSVTLLRGPFRILTDFNLSGDHHTRVILFTSDLGLSQPDPLKLTVTAGGTLLLVENVGTVTGVSGLVGSYIIVRLPDGLSPGDLPLIVTLNGAASSNSPTLAISP